MSARDEYKAAEKAGTLVKESGYTVGSYAMQWLPVHKKGVRANTYNGYVYTLKGGLESIQDVRLSDLSTDDIARCYASLVGKSAGYIAKFRSLLTAILDSAVDAEYLRRNPCRAGSVKVPSGKAGGHRCITPEERQLIRTVRHPLQLAALVMLYTGLRRGEALALQPEDIADGHISVTKAVEFVNHRPTIGPPKTAGSVRRVPVPDVLAEFLKNAAWPIMPPGEFMWMWEKYNRALSEAAGHPVSIRCHDLRVSYCTMLRDAGVDIKQAMIWMGHADEKMILRVYDQPGPEREKQAETLLNRLLNGQNDGQTVSETPRTVEK